MGRRRKSRVVRRGWFSPARREFLWKLGNLLVMLTTVAANVQTLIGSWVQRPAPAPLKQVTSSDSLSLKVHESPPHVAIASATATAAGTSTAKAIGDSVTFKEGPRIRLVPHR